jgi:hypothetical protein
MFPNRLYSVQHVLLPSHGTVGPISENSPVRKQLIVVALTVGVSVLPRTTLPGSADSQKVDTGLETGL